MKKQSIKDILFSQRIILSFKQKNFLISNQNLNKIDTQKFFPLKIYQQKNHFIFSQFPIKIRLLLSYKFITSQQKSPSHEAPHPLSFLSPYPPPHQLQSLRPKPNLRSSLLQPNRPKMGQYNSWLWPCYHRICWLLIKFSCFHDCWI